MITDVIHYDAHGRLGMHRGQQHLQACGLPPIQSLCHIMWGRECMCVGGWGICDNCHLVRCLAHQHM